MGVRRVVTGHDSNGKAVFASDGMVEPVTPSLLGGFSFLMLWGADELPRLPDDGSLPSYASYFPPPGGVRFGVFTIPPDKDLGSPEDLDIVAVFAELEALLPGLAQSFEPDAPGMHKSATVDFEVILSGEVVLELDDGATVTLKPGDTVVQNGTRHRWSNPGEVPALMAGFACGVPHEGVEGG